MVEKCANPACCATFHRLGEGRLFIKEVEGGPRDGRVRSRQLRYCWLCDSCRRTMTVITEPGKEIKVAPLPAPAAGSQQEEDGQPVGYQGQKERPVVDCV